MLQSFLENANGANDANGRESNKAYVVFAPIESTENSRD
jgi:hypothetical protein